MQNYLTRQNMGTPGKEGKIKCSVKGHVGSGKGLERLHGRDGAYSKTRKRMVYYYTHQEE